MVALAGLSACDDEKATLSGADAVYIEMTPTDPTLCAGDTLYVSAVVSNVAGKVIDTPVKWSVDDESVAQVVEIRSAKPAKKGSRAEEGEEGEGEGEGDDNGFNDGDGELLPPDPVAVDSIITYRTAVIGMKDAQGKSTKLRATLENGDYAITTLSVVSRGIKDAISAYVETKRSYQREMNDTVWFAVSPYSILSECTPSYEFEILEVYNASDRTDENVFVHPYETMAENIIMDEENSRIGAIFTAPRICGKAQCTMTLTNREGTTVSAKADMNIFPAMSPGFEVDGKRPGYGPETPSNIKQTLINPTMDINSTHLVGVCLGVDKGLDVDVLNASAAEDNGFCYWEIEGSAVVVEDAYYDFKYDTNNDQEEIGMGYVSYLKVRSGTREGLTTIRYVMPDQTLVCNLTVEDFKKSHPVERVYVTDGDLTDPKEITSATFRLGEPASLNIMVEPAASFRYHGVTITSSDNSIIEPMEHGESDGNVYRFTTKKTGNAVLTLSSLDKAVQFPVTVTDRVMLINWEVGTVDKVMNGATAEIKANVRMASGSPITHEVTWKVSDPTIATVTTKPGTYDVGVVTGLQPGNFTVVAEYDGVQSPVMQMEVLAVQDLHASEFDLDFRMIGDNGDGTFYIILGEDMDVYAAIPFVTEGEFDGTFDGSDAYVEWNEIYEGASYHLVIVNNGDDTVTITGYIQVPTGGKVVMNGDTFMLY